MKLKKKDLLYDIANMAYIIADTGEYGRHTLHRVRDICQDGNIDRVSRILGLSYATLLSVMIPILEAPKIDVNRDFSSSPHDYCFNFNTKGNLKRALTTEIKLKIREICHEYMVCMVLADWLAVTLPEAADVWKFRAEKALETIKGLVAEVMLASYKNIKRRLWPF